MKASANGLAVELNEEAEAMFGDKAKAQLNDFEKLKASLSKVKLNENEATEIKSKLSDLDRQLQSADNEAESIRHSIMYKSHYCDDEYRRAQILVRDYENLRRQRVDLQNRSNRAAQSASQTLNKLRADSNRLTDLKKQLEEMNAVAKKRKQADTMRGELRSQLNSIEKSWAEKFFAGDYKALQSDVEKAIAAGDDGLIKNFNGVYSTVAAFKTKLQARVEQWKREKADAEGLLNEVEALSKLELFEPIDYYNAGEGAQRAELFDYINRYGGKDLRTGYRKALDEAKALIGKEKFVESIDKLKAASELVMDARNVGIKLQENMIKKTELAGAIQEVMVELRYDVELNITNDNPNDGFSITCSIGDETINFDRVDIDDTGKVIIDIDHHEAIGGTCNTSWQAISKRMNVAGIPVTDVLKNDRSILYPQRKTAPGEGQRAVTN